MTPYILNQALLKLYQTSNKKEALRNYQKVIKSSLRDATYYFGFIKNNPAGDLQIPRVLSFELKKRYTNEEIEIILNRFKDNKVFICAFLTACYTGMRTGEVFALTWDDIDLENRIIKINKTVYAKDNEKKGRWYLGTTKTVGSCREVYICDTLYLVLCNYKKLQNKYKKEYGKKYKQYVLEEVRNKYGKLIEYKVVENTSKHNRVKIVFTRKDGTYSGTDMIKDPNSIIKELLNTNCRFYDLRGTFATRTAHDGVVLKDIAAILGHASTKVTERSYVSALNEEIRQAIDKMNRLVSSDTISETIKFNT